MALISEIADLLQQSEHAVVFTGAGMSTASGIPDYRSKTGLWRKKDPSKLASIEAMETNRDEFIQFYKERLQLYKSKSPNEGHYLLAKWEKEGKIQSIITQNIDGFHLLAGSKNVIELHGTLQTFHCHNCGQRFLNDVYLKNQYYCGCGGFIRPSITLFGELLSEDAFRDAELECEKADIMIVLGSSLTVRPANEIPFLAKRMGAVLVIVNQEQTDFDEWADFVFHNDILQFLNELNNRLNR